MEILHEQKTVSRYNKNVYLTSKKYHIFVYLSSVFSKDKTYSSAERQPDPPAVFSLGSTAQFSEMPLCCSSYLHPRPCCPSPRHPNTLTSEPSASSSARSSQNHQYSPQAAGKWHENLNICDCCSSWKSDCTFTDPKYGVPVSSVFLRRLTSVNLQHLLW